MFACRAKNNTTSPIVILVILLVLLLIFALMKQTSKGSSTQSSLQGSGRSTLTKVGSARDPVSKPFVSVVPRTYYTHTPPPSTKKIVNRQAQRLVRQPVNGVRQPAMRVGSSQGSATAATSISYQSPLNTSPPLATTTVAAKLAEIAYVEDFGAVGDGVTDDTVAIQNAVNSGARVIYLQAKTYLITEASMATTQNAGWTGALVIKPHIQLIGQGNGPSVILYSGTGNAIFVWVQGTDFGNDYETRLKGFSLSTISSGPLANPYVGTGIFAYQTDFLVCESLSVTGFETGFTGVESLYHTHRNCLYNYNIVGCNYFAAPGSASGGWNNTWFNNVLTFDTCVFKNCVDYTANPCPAYVAANNNLPPGTPPANVIGCVITGCEVVFTNCDYSGNSIGLYVSGADCNEVNTAQSVSIISPYCESCPEPFKFYNAIVVLQNGFVNTGGPTSPATCIVSIDQGSNVFWSGRLKDEGYWSQRCSVTNNSTFFMDWGFNNSAVVPYNAPGNNIAGVSYDSTSIVSYPTWTNVSTLNQFSSSTSSPMYTLYNNDYSC